MIDRQALRTNETVTAHPPENPTRRNSTAAVIVIHGMGRQTRYDTLATIANLLVEEHERQEKRRPETRVGEKQLTPDMRTMSAEFTLASRNGHAKDVSVFEVYWAPLTEGKISFLSTIRFLIVSALLGFWQFMQDGRQFRRWQFGKVRSFHTSARTFTGLLLATLAVIALVVLYGAFLFSVIYKAVTALVFALKLVTPESFPRSEFNLAQQIDVFLFSFTFPAGTVVLLSTLALFLTKLIVRLEKGHVIPYKLLYYLMLAFGCALLAIMITSGWSILLLLADYGFATLPGHVHVEVAKRFLDWLTDLIDVLAYNQYSAMTWFWLAVNTVLFWLFHVFIQEFVGDVAIYVTAHRADRFWDTREQIQSTAVKVAQAVYDSTVNGRHIYDEIYIVGHSLGSVIAYDTLNSLIRDDSVRGDRTRGVLERTKLLLTYGSPLDKTAYLFRSYAEDLGIRMAAGAARQPLILHDGFRSMPWINIFSRADIIGAPLDFYDSHTSKVHNLEDKEGFVPFLAHTQYGDHSILRRVLHTALVQTVPDEKSH